MTGDTEAAQQAGGGRPDGVDEPRRAQRLLRAHRAPSRRRRPPTAGPVLVHALDGFLSAGPGRPAGRRAPARRAMRAGGQVVAELDVDRLFDYRARRPPLAFDQDHYAGYEAPRLDVRRLTDAAGTPYLLLRRARARLPAGRASPTPCATWSTPSAYGWWSASAPCRWACRTPGRSSSPRTRPAPSWSTGRTCGPGGCWCRRARRRCSSCGWGSGATTRSATSRTCRTTWPRWSSHPRR